MGFLRTVAVLGLALGFTRTAGAAEPEAPPPAVRLECGQSGNWVDELICRTPDLLAATRKLEEATALKATEGRADGDSYRTYDKYQREWIEKRALACGGRMPANAAEDHRCAATLQQATAIYMFAILRHTSRKAEAEQHDKDVRARVSFPADWWGFTRKGWRFSYGALYAGEDGNLYAGLWAGDFLKGAVWRSTMVNVFTGAEVASSATDPLAVSNNVVHAFMLARLGLEQIQPEARTAVVTVQQSRPDCNSPRIFNVEGKAYIYAWLPKAVTREEDSLCEEGWGLGVQARTSDFEGLYAGESIGPFQDGTSLAILDGMRPEVTADEWLIRFKADVTSPFFAGRTDIVRADSRMIDDIIGYDHYPTPPDEEYGKIVAAVRAKLRELTETQAMSRP